MIRLAELIAIRDRGPLWQGLTERGDIPIEVLETERLGYIERVPEGEGFRITATGRHFISAKEAGKKQVCPKCNRPLP